MSDLATGCLECGTSYGHYAHCKNNPIRYDPHHPPGTIRGYNIVQVVACSIHRHGPAGCFACHERLSKAFSEAMRREEAATARIARMEAALRENFVHLESSNKHDGYLSECLLCVARGVDGEEPPHKPTCILFRAP